MVFREIIRSYYSGQKTVAIVGALVALVLVLLAAAAFRQSGQPAHAFGITTLVIAGGFMLPANVAYFFYVGPQSERIESMLKRSPVEFRTSEATHLTKMLRGFHRSYRIDGLAATVGVALLLVGLFHGNNKMAGIGLAVSLCALTLLAGEVWSKQRALHYRDAFQAVAIRD
jgi:hypothetical protein